MTHSTTGPGGDLVDVGIVGVDQQDPAQMFVTLQEKNGDRRFPVFVGRPEAAAIAFALEERASLRPMTHDALKQVIEALGGRVDRIVVGYVPETSIFTADVVVAVADATERHLDWRLSDALALAVRCDPLPSILVPAALLDGPGWLGPEDYRLPCPSCRAAIYLTESELQPVDGAPDLAVARVTCPACQAHQTVHLRRAFGPRPEP